MPTELPPMNVPAVEDWCVRQLRSRKHWDEMPEAGVLFEDSRSRNSLGHRKFPLLPFIWDGAPWATLDRIARFPALLHQVQSYFYSPGASSIRALYLRCEAFAPSEETNREHIRRLEAGGSVPRLSEDPRSQEMRMINTLDTHGNMVSCTITRGKEGEAPHIMRDLNREGEKITGNIRASMENLMRRLLDQD